MPKLRQITYYCSNCDAQHPKWLGRCSECGSWGTIFKKPEDILPKSAINTDLAAPTTKFSDINTGDNLRIKTNIKEFDRVLGGGFVPSSLVLLGGEPGIGKSTLVLQIAEKISSAVLYVSGEESARQIKMRLDRLNIKGENIDFLGETDAETICATISKNQPAIAIIDSIQTIYSSQNPAEPGGVSQIKIATAKILEAAKKSNSAVLIIGHITKDGAVAGPKTLEHLVDSVIYLEGDRYNFFRILRTVKNRFGSTNEIGVFEMTGRGLQEVSNPSLIFLNQNNGNENGVAVTPTLEGLRVFLAEIQALVTKTSFGYPQRKSLGIDPNRLLLLIAVLQKKIKIKLYDQDIHINVAGGLKINDPSADLAACQAIISAEKNQNLPGKTVAIGEISLSGEVRPCSLMEKRIKEIERLGFEKIIAPPAAKNIKTSCEFIFVKNLFELNQLIEKG